MGRFGSFSRGGSDTWGGAGPRGGSGLRGALLAEQEALDLARRGLGQLAHEVDLAREGVGPELGLDPLLQLGLLLAPAVDALAQDDVRLEDLAGQVVRYADDGRLEDVRVTGQHRLHVEGPDAVAGHDDHVVV